MFEEQALPEWVSPEELAGWLNIPVSSIYLWRRKGYGPKSSKVGRHVRYRHQDIEQWMADQAEVTAS